MAERSYRFRRRYLNSALLVHAGIFIALLWGAWATYTGWPTLAGAGVTLFILGMAGASLVAVTRQPRRLYLEPEHLEVYFLFGSRRFPYTRVERLHWMRSRNPLGGFRARDVLKIEMKDGQWITLDHMRGKLKTIRGILESRVYGQSL